MTAAVESPHVVTPVATDVTFRIRRFHPEIDAEPHWQDFTSSSTRPTACSTPSTRSSGSRTAR